MIRLFLAALLPSLIAAITLPALGQRQERPQQAPEPKGKVSVLDSEFKPDLVSIAVGESVRWTNQSERDHKIVAEKDAFAAGTIKAGKTLTRTFEKAGTFKYYCSLHPRAKGTVEVKPAAAR